jgi:hypothetical protein
MPYPSGVRGGFTGTVAPKGDPVFEIVIGCIVALFVGILLFFVNPYINPVQATIVASDTPKRYNATYTIDGQTYTVVFTSDTSLVGTRTIYASFLSKGNAKLKSGIIGYLIGAILMFLSVSLLIGFFGYMYYKSKKQEGKVVYG